MVVSFCDAALPAERLMGRLKKRRLIDQLHSPTLSWRQLDCQPINRSVNQLWLFEVVMRTSIEKIRRAELAEAALATLAEFGHSGTTVSRVAERAGMSQGLVHHYFKSKTDLLEVAMRQLNAHSREQVLECVKRADTPREKLYAVVASLFPPDLFERGFAQAWLSFCAEAAFTPSYARIQRVMFSRMHSNVSWYLRSLLPGDEVASAARTICVFSHGCWLRCALDEDPLDREQTIRQMHGLLDTLLAAPEV